MIEEVHERIGGYLIDSILQINKARINYINSIIHALSQHRQKNEYQYQCLRKVYSFSSQRSAYPFNSFKSLCQKAKQVLNLKKFCLCKCFYNVYNDFMWPSQNFCTLELLLCFCNGLQNSS